MDSAQAQQLVVTIYTVFAGISCAELIIYALFILYCEVLKPGNRVSVIATPLNVTLLLGTASIMGLYIVKLIILSTSLATPWGALFALEIIFLATAETCYIYFSFRRSTGLMKMVLSPKMFKVVYYSTVFSPCCFYLPVVPCILQAAIVNASSHKILLSWLDFITEIISGLTIVGLELIFVCGYVSFLLQTRLENEGINREFLIIAYAGIAACCICFGSVAIYVLSFIFMDDVPHALLLAASHCMINFLVMSQFTMKVLLHRLRVAEGVLDSLNTRRVSSIHKRREDDNEKHINTLN